MRSNLGGECWWVYSIYTGKDTLLCECVCVTAFFVSKPTQQRGETSITAHSVIQPNWQLHCSHRPSLGAGGADWEMESLRAAVTLTPNRHSLLLCRNSICLRLCVWVSVKTWRTFSFFRRGNWSDTPCFSWEVRKKTRQLPVSDRRVEAECRLQKVMKTQKDRETQTEKEKR